MAGAKASTTMTQDERLFLVECQVRKASEALRFAVTMMEGCGPIRSRKAKTAHNDRLAEILRHTQKLVRT